MKTDDKDIDEGMKKALKSIKKEKIKNDRRMPIKEFGNEEYVKIIIWYYRIGP